MSDEKITAWVTKYALTKGIYKALGSVNVRTGNLYFYGRTHGYHVYKNIWHRTEAEAMARAEEMRTAKIASLKKQIAKLEQLKIRVIE
jgi:hypothetical protein